MSREPLLPSPASGPPPDPDILKHHRIYHRIRQQAEQVLPQGSGVPEIWGHDLSGARLPLSGFWAEQPLLLVTACLSCGQARRWLDGLVELRQRHGQSVRCLLFYTLEAHPEGSDSPYTEGEWVSAKNTAANIHCTQPQSLEERLFLARDLMQSLGGGLECLVDDMSDTGWRSLGGGPNMGLLIDRQGRVRVKQGWFHPPEMEAAIQTLISSAD